MGSEILSKYYEGILSQLHGEVDSVNEIFQHQGLKGEGNESAIRNLLTKFIPRKYGIGSGIVIDRDGSPSRQSDIVIYDNHNYPEILSLTSVHIYPVDLVYATIEVKTTLDSVKARQAIENIKSVKSLNYIEDSFRQWPIDAVFELKADTELWRTTTTTSPVGIVFAYRSDTSDYHTFTNWFKKADDEETKHWPSHVFCLDQGIIFSPGWENRTCTVFPLGTDNSYYKAKPDRIKKINGKEWVEQSGRLFPLSMVNEDKLPIDQSKLLLYFVTLLTEILARKLLSPKINFLETYLSSDLATLFAVAEEDKTIKVLRQGST